ncbi:hypothetical protein [Streptomyces justiciae]|uniref:hypothetical protein n=1 Tax=Streptomyces justiciae TaxID=2780140 RepID=UPI0021187004|nr:hypothetical protein [Streptomyces justiciae]MCW8379507.1 hypothetical protein [Streptomyces justiciae]
MTVVGAEERGLAYDVFGPLWSVLDLAAVAGSSTLTTFVTAHRAELDGLLAVVQAIGDFSPETMRLFERQGGWGDGSGDVTAESLMLHSGCIEEYPPNVDDPLVLRRMLGMGADLQLARLMEGLVGVAVARGPGVERGTTLVVAAMRRAAALAVPRSVSDVFRMWRVAFLPGVLRPDSPTPETARTGVRAYAHALEGVLLDGPG